jgi:hypothetical protein
MERGINRAREIAIEKVKERHRLRLDLGKVKEQENDVGERDIKKVMERDGEREGD